MDQDVAIAPRKATKLTFTVAQWAERGTANVMVIDNLWITVQRSEDYLRRVKSLLNIGGLMRYDEGKGGIVLNQLKLLEREVNPVNVAKKRAIYKTLLGNLGAVFAGERTVVAGSQLTYAPVRIPDQRFNAYVRSDKQPAWWKGPGDLTGLPVGEQTFSGVRFFLSNFSTSPVPTVFMLRGKEASVKDERIDGLAVGAKADALFFLHTFNRSNDLVNLDKTAANLRSQRKEVPEPPTVLTYRVQYADGSETQVPVRWGREIGHWLAVEPKDLPAASVGWAGPLAGAKDGSQAVVYVMQWTNPEPTKAIASIDLVASDAKWGSAAVCAITTATTIK